MIDDGVVVDVVFEDGLLYLELANLSDRPALNVTCKFDPPLVDMQGALVGINSAIATTGGQGGSIGVGFAIPINQAKRVAEELERTGRATRAVLGVALATSDRTANGAAIGQVTPGGPAEQAGLRAGEVVTRVDDRLVTNGNELVAAIRDHAPGDRVTLTVDERQVDVTLGGQTG